MAFRVITLILISLIFLKYLTLLCLQVKVILLLGLLNNFCTWKCVLVGSYDIPKDCRNGIEKGTCGTKNFEFFAVFS